MGTSYQYKKINADAKGRGSDLSIATQSGPIRTRAELGAALKSNAKIREIIEIGNPSLSWAITIICTFLSMIR